MDFIGIAKEYWQPFLGVVGSGGLVAFFSHRKDLVKTLMIRVNHLEELSAQERKACSAKIELLNTRLQHTQNNFSAIMMGLRLAPEKAAQIVIEMERILGGNNERG